MEQLGKKCDKTYEELEQMMEEWFNDGSLQEYMRNKFYKWVVYNRGSQVEIFIGDDEIDDYGDNKGYQDACYMVETVLEKNSIVDLTGEELSWATDRMLEGTLFVYPYSEMTDVKDLKLEYDEDGKLLYFTADKQTEKEFLHVDKERLANMLKNAAEERNLELSNIVIENHICNRDIVLRYEYEVDEEVEIEVYETYKERTPNNNCLAMIVLSEIKNILSDMSMKDVAIILDSKYWLKKMLINK